MPTLSVVAVPVLAQANGHSAILMDVLKVLQRLAQDVTQLTIPSQSVTS